MSEAAVTDAIRQVMDARRAFARWLAADRSRIRAAMVDPILWALGWRTWLPSECRLNAPLRRSLNVDYVLLDQEGRATAAIAVVSNPSLREHNRQRMEALVAGFSRGTGALTNGVHWEIYDLTIPGRALTGKLVERFTLGTYDPAELEDAAIAFDYWLGRNREDRSDY